nr:YdcF family protein [Acuticoccus kalidii]
MAPLEAQFDFAGVTEAPDGIIVLGGYLAPSRSATQHHVVFNENASRFTEGAALAVRFPDAKIILTDGAEIDGGPSGAELAAAKMRELGIDPARMIVESRSRSTYENALFSHDLVEPKPGERYILVTSDAHMPRAIATFAQLGWPGLVAWPVAGLDDGGALWQKVGGPAATNLKLVDDATREYMALLLYRILGRTDALLPGKELLSK